MHWLPAEQQVILITQATALTALCVRFLWTGLYRVYSYFFVYLVLALLQTAMPEFVPLDSKRYLQIFLTSEAVVVCCYVLVVLEEYSNLLREMAGIARLARQYIKITLAMAVLVSVLLASRMKTPATLPQYFLVCERVVMAALLVFVLSSVAFLAYYPVPLSRNVVVYSIGFAVYLLTKASALFLGLGAPRLHPWIREINTVSVATSTICLLFWLFALSRQGENKKVLTVHPWNPEDERRILDRLRTINESLLRTVRTR